MHPTSWREVVNDSKHACEITAQMCCLHSAVKEGQQACVQGLSAWVTDRVRKQKRTLCKEKLSVSCVWLVKWFWWNEYKETWFFFVCFKSVGWAVESGTFLLLCCSGKVSETWCPVHDCWYYQHIIALPDNNMLPFFSMKYGTRHHCIWKKYKNTSVSVSVVTMSANYKIVLESTHSTLRLTLNQWSKSYEIRHHTWTTEDLSFFLSF